jgi:4a-hydroxytetrahydrobiopterin dehydratase
MGRDGRVAPDRGLGADAADPDRAPARAVADGMGGSHGRVVRRGASWYHVGMDTLDDATIDRDLSELDGWRRDGDAITRTVELDGFRAAIDLIVAIADEAERADHHPELTNVYATVTIRLTSHDAGGVTERDLRLARAIDPLVP